MKVEDRDRGIRVLHLRFVVGDVLRDEVLHAELFLRVHDHVRNVVLPIEGNAAEVGLVANLVIDIIELVQLGNDLPNQGFVNGNEATGLVQGINVGSWNISDVVDVIGSVL